MATIQKRKLADGSLTYRVQIRRKGYPTRTATRDTRAEAEAWARDIESAMDKRAYQASSAEGESLTLGKALERYERERTERKKGKRQEVNRIRQWQREELAARPLAHIHGTDLAEIRDRMADAGRAASTIRNYLNLISNLYNVARREWHIAGLHNPVGDIYVPQPATDGRQRRLEGDEEARLLESAGYPLRELIILAIETAMRAGELRSLKRADIDRKRRTARLRAHKADHWTQAQTGRTVPLSPLALEVIKGLPKQIGGSLFPTTSASHLSHRFGDLCKSLSIEDLHFHDLRHEATSRLVESGLYSMPEIMAITGHKTERMVMVYYQPRAEDLAKRMR